MHMRYPVLPGVAHALLYTVYAINGISFSQQGMAVHTRTEDHKRVLMSTVLKRQQGATNKSSALVFTCRR